jgi:hypothetical protein
MSLLGHGLFAASLTRSALLDRKSFDPRDCQLASLRALVRRARDTHSGRQHGFATIRDEGEFRANVPLRDYAALAPWLSRALYLRAGGERDLLDGKAILLGSTPELERRASGVLVGDNTGIMARHMPRWVRHKHLPSPRVRA